MPVSLQDQNTDR